MKKIGHSKCGRIEISIPGIFPECVFCVRVKITDVYGAGVIQTMFVDSKKRSLSSDEFLTAIQAVEAFSTIDDLMVGSAESVQVKYSYYQHFPAVGALDFNKSGRFHGYNTPDYVKEFYSQQVKIEEDPMMFASFSSGHFMWLSDFFCEPTINASDYQDNVRMALKYFGDGFCCPLYGPDNRKGYAFVGFCRDKSEFDPIFSYQLQSILHVMHVRYCLLRKGLQNQVNLTPREAEVLELISYGKSNPEIAKIMEISSHTVAGYAKKVFVKLGTSDRVSAALRAQTMDIKI